MCFPSISSQLCTLGYPRAKLSGERPYHQPLTTSITTSRRVLISVFSSHQTLTTSTMGLSRKRKGSEEEEDVVVKKSKSSGSAPTRQKDGDGNPYWEVGTESVAYYMKCYSDAHSQISGKRRLQISEFKNMTMVNIREFYEKDGKSLPGKAGINLPLEQFTTFLSLLPQVLQELESKGHKIEMPVFEGGGAATTKDDEEEEEEEEELKPKKSKKTKKANIEATSDEEEDDD